MTHQQDQTIRRALQDLRDVDEITSPDFDAVLQRHQPVRRLDSRRAASVAFAAGVMLVTGTVIVRQATKAPTRLVVPAEVIALSNWRPVTDVLLQTAQREFLNDSPRKDELILNPDTAKERQ